MNPILFPVIALVFLTFVVTGCMFRERVAESKAKRIHPQKMSSSSKLVGLLENTRAADNYKNLFELPVLFYALVLILITTGNATSGFVIAAWAFVALRAVHSFIHIGYNRVIHRFFAFAASSAVLLGMWIAFAAQLLSK